MDRRSSRRYNIALNLRWKLLHGKQNSGTGTTIDLSTGGVLFETDHELRAEAEIELSIAWPVLLRKVAPLKLVVGGEVVRVMDRRVAVRAWRYEFRTVGIPLDHRRADHPTLVAQAPRGSLRVAPTRT